MTREEALTNYIVPAIKRTWNDKKCKEILEALEQEPILNEIKAELHATAEMQEDGVYYLREKWIDEIINKYKAE